MMMTIEEIESACEISQPPNFSRHALDAPELSLCRTFYPLGFPAEIRTNSAEILSELGELWKNFRQRFDTEAIEIEIHVVEDESNECPPAPGYRILPQLLMSVSDQNNYSISHLSLNKTQMTLSSATVRQKQFLRFHFLDGCAAAHIATRYSTPVHAGCVALHGRGVLLCGDSGAGKSTLSYACARAGWEYVTDDASFLLNGSSGRVVTGNCYQVRFRPSARELFPEVAGLEITPRAAGKPSIEMPTSHLITPRQSVQVDFIVFLNRNSGEWTQLVPYRKDVAREFMRQVLFGSERSLAVQYEAIERLLTADVYELRYNDLDRAVGRLRTLVEEAA